MVKVLPRILFVASEVAPLVKTGGLADVAGELPQALKNLGCDIRIVLPFYSAISKDEFNIKNLDKKITIPLGNDLNEEVTLYETQIYNNIKVYLIKNDHSFERAGIYRTDEGDYPDNDKRFILFCRAVLEMLPLVDFIPDVIHANDWQTGLIPLYLKHCYSYKIKSVFTIHNLAYQGQFPRSALDLAGLGEEFFNIHALEFYGKVNFIKSGIVYSDVITTVSSRYAEEIQTEEFGCGLQGLLHEKRDHLRGIINGIDCNIWNPAINSRIIKNYNNKELKGKKDCKRDLQISSNLPVTGNVPIFGMITRLADQKGFDILVEIFDKLMTFDLQFVLLGTGEKKYHDILTKYAALYPKKVAINLGFDSILAEKIYAGADMFLMPSYFEPCGLGQLISMKFGTIPVVRGVGGLYDSVVPFNSSTLKGTGFVFDDYKGQALLLCVKESLKVYKDSAKWHILMHNAMKKDFSWKSSAKKYLELYSS
ncbi:glycogen synthase GlgA [Candidatus Poribacteria bacterium]|nr:glycogen synthase GlgA [Candidatus Poribacteria bacterium]